MFQDKFIKLQHSLHLRFAPASNLTEDTGLVFNCLLTSHTGTGS